MNPAEVYMHHYQTQEPNFYTQVPNIIDHLTYEIEEKGVKITKRLSVYAKELYRVIRMIAKDHGKDWHTTESLAEIIGCSVGSIINAKKELLMPMIQLENSPLIIEERSPLKKIIEGKTIKTTLCKRMIVDIWKWNNAFMATKKHQMQFGRFPDSCGESGWSPDSCGESAPQGPDSCGESIKNNTKKNPLSKEQQPTAKADPVCSLHAKCSVVSAQSASPPEKEAKINNFNLLMKMGFGEIAALNLIASYSGCAFIEAFRYLNEQKIKKKILNELGYFRKILEGKWWEKKTI
jgi:hypothetical protein